jgi:hypothetical protein
MARNPFVRRTWGLGICLLSLLAARSLAAQTEPAPQAGGGGPAAGSQASPGGQPPATSIPRVVAARSNDKDHPNRSGLGDGITLTVEHLREGLANVNKGCDGLILFLNEIPIKGVPPESCSLADGGVRFTLDRTDDSDRAWHALLEEPIAFNKIISVSVGPDGSLSFPTKVDKFELEVLPQLQLYTYFVCLAVFLLLFLRLATRTPLLRDRNAMTPAGKLPPYSLSRFQLAFWSILVVAAYLFIWLITEELDTITGSVLALLGIGSATALGANLIDTGKKAAAAGEDGQQTQPAPAPPPTKGAVSQGFLRDVLSDAEGISLYRFQLFVWTWVLGVIFVASVYNGLQMPQFNPTLLGLMGISSGTYLGFKVPENRPGTE